MDIGSDHRLVRAKVRINKKLERQRMIKRGKTRHIDIELLSSKQDQFQIELHNRFASLKDLIEDQPLNQTYEKITNAVLEEAEKLAKRPKTSTPTADKDKEEIQKLNEKRKELKPFRQKTVQNQVEYTELNKTIRKKRRKRKRKFRTKLVRKTLENHKGPKAITRKWREARNSYHQ